MKKIILGVICFFVFCFCNIGIGFAYPVAENFVFPINNYTDDVCLDWGGIITGKDGILKQHVADDYCVPIKQL